MSYLEKRNQAAGVLMVFKSPVKSQADAAACVCKCVCVWGQFDVFRIFFLPCLIFYSAIFHLLIATVRWDPALINLQKNCSRITFSKLLSIRLTWRRPSCFHAVLTPYCVYCIWQDFCIFSPIMNQNVKHIIWHNSMTFFKF